MAKSAKERNRERSQKNRLWYDEYMKNFSCAHCGLKDPEVFEWHHKDPNKKDVGIGKMLGRYPISSIIREISKCICLCANCHRKLHHKEKGKIRRIKLPSVFFDI